MKWINLSSRWLQIILLVLGIIFSIFELCKKRLLNLAEYFECKAEYNSKSISEVKQEIKSILINRQQKLIIIVDDIDRLNQSEIKQIFGLIKINADFPNTIYLLAFDRKVVEQNLEEQSGVSGKDYLDKIVQVNFNIPFTRSSKILEYLLQEIDRILDILPESAKDYFDKDELYFTNVFNSGFRVFLEL